MAVASSVPTFGPHDVYQHCVAQGVATLRIFAWEPYPVSAGLDEAGGSSWDVGGPACRIYGTIRYTINYRKRMDVARSALRSHEYSCVQNSPQLSSCNPIRGSFILNLCRILRIASESMENQ